ncbi:hypothetical protein Hanom_Chr12g01070861 [Helianthus anomalus]
MMATSSFLVADVAAPVGFVFTTTISGEPNIRYAVDDSSIWIYISNWVAYFWRLKVKEVSIYRCMWYSRPDLCSLEFNDKLPISFPIFELQIFFFRRLTPFPSC